MRTAVRVFVVTLLWAPVVVLVGRFATGGPADFSGFEIGAKATAAQWTFDSPSLGVPAEPTGEFNVAFSETTLKSGPVAYGLGSIAWPGQVAAGLPSFLQGEIERNSGQKFPTNVPNYPVRAESFHPQGPSSASSDVGTMSMRSSAREAIAEGSAHANALGFPGVGDAGMQTSQSFSGFDAQGAVALTEASADDISLIGGLIKIDSVVTRAAARSDGVKGTVAGTTTVAAAEVAGTSVRIDSTGVHAGDGEGIDTAATQQVVNQALAGAGVSMELAQPVDTVQGPSASRSLGGLLVRVKASAVDALVSALPAPIQDQIRGQITFDQDMTVQFAPAVVRAGAAKVFEFGVDTPAVAGGSVGDTVVATPSGDAALTPVGEASGPVTSSGGAPTVIEAAPAAVAQAPGSFTGVPLWLVALLVLVALVSSRPLTAAADRLLAARAGASCPYQEA